MSSTRARGATRSSSKKRKGASSSSDSFMRLSTTTTTSSSLLLLSSSSSSSPSRSSSSSNVDDENKEQQRKKRTREQDSAASSKGIESNNEVPTSSSLESSSSTSKKLVGAHVSISGGIEKSVAVAASIGARSFAMFTRSARSWKPSPPLSENAIEAFEKAIKKFGFNCHDAVMPHGSYLPNLGSPDKALLAKSRATFLEEMKRCEALGIRMLNFHPGSTLGEITVEQCLDVVAESINLAHRETKSVMAVVENTAGQGNTIGHRFEHLKRIIDGVTDKTRVGVCIDTCHAFAAGYDLRTAEACKATFDAFDRIVGFKYLCGLHLNDSKGELGCKKDRHENIGKGKIGLEGFRYIMNDPRFDNLPMILETPAGDYSKEIQLLYSLVEQQQQQQQDAKESSHSDRKNNNNNTNTNNTNNSTKTKKKKKKNEAEPTTTTTTTTTTTR